MIWLIGAAAILGITLVILGWRGRRIDDHPVCRRCGFDLIGLSARPGAPRCPECGADLARPRATRHGNRKRRRLALGSGISILLVLAAGAVLVLESGRFKLRPYLPVWMLMLEARTAGGNEASDAVSELTTRYASGDLSGGRVDTLVQRALELQANARAPWFPAWGGIIEAARAKGRLTPAQIAQYVKNGVTFDFIVRDQSVIGAECGAELRVSGPRLAVSSGLYIKPLLLDLTLDGKPAQRAGGASMLGIGWGGISTTIESLHLDGEPGKHTLRSRWRIQVLDAANPGNPILTEWEVPAAAPVELLPAGTELIHLKPDESLRPIIESSISALGLTFQGSGPDAELRGLLQVNNPAAPLAFDVFIRDHTGREWPAGTIAVAAAPKGQSSSNSTGFSATVLGLTDRQVDVILRPSIAAAAKTTYLKEIWDGQIVLPAQPVQWPPESDAVPDPVGLPHP